MVIEARNPLGNITKPRSPILMVKRGRRFGEADYRPATAAEMAGEE